MRTPFIEATACDLGGQFNGLLAFGRGMNAGYLSDSDESTISTTEDPAEPQRNTRRGTNFYSDNGGWMKSCIE
jgi:hypothetical protein